MKKRVSEIGLHKAVELLIPSLVEAGKLAMHLQKRIVEDGIEGPKQKDGDPGHSALTDADLLIEDYLGIQLLNLFEDVTFAGEEKGSDRISKFFPKTAEYTVTLDPINGTLLFKNGIPYFDIVLTFCVGTKIVAAVDFLPALGVAYVGFLEDAPGFLRGCAFIINGPKFHAWPPFHVKRSSRTILTQRASPEDIRKLTDAGFRVMELSHFDGSNKDWKYGSFSLLTGDVCAIIKKNASLIDFGAAGFIASRAGGIINKSVFDPETLRTPVYFAASDQGTFIEILKVLGGSYI